MDCGSGTELDTLHGYAAPAAQREGIKKMKSSSTSLTVGGITVMEKTDLVRDHGKSVVKTEEFAPSERR